MQEDGAAPLQVVLYATAVPYIPLSSRLLYLQPVPPRPAPTPRANVAQPSLSPPPSSVGATKLAPETIALLEVGRPPEHVRTLRAPARAQRLACPVGAGVLALVPLSRCPSRSLED
jgi:hypothetical protein